MVIRSVYSTRKDAPYYYEHCIEVSGNKKEDSTETRVGQLHAAFKHLVEDKKVMEFSSKSDNKSVKKLLPGKLVKLVDGQKVTVNNIFKTAERVTADGSSAGGIAVNVVNKTVVEEGSRKAPKAIGYKYDGHIFSSRPRQMFYNYLYINALLEHPDMMAELAEYDAFSDSLVASNSGNPVPAQAVAIYVSLARLGLLEKARDPEEFEKLFKVG